MAARQLKTIDDPMGCPVKRVELIGGEIVRRPTARSEQAMM
jgi:hypothetical protein